LVLGQISLGIFEAYSRVKYSNIKFNDKCQHLQGAIMGGCINDLFAGIGCFCCLFCLSNDNIYNILFELHGLKISYDIVSIITYNMNLKCYDFITENTPFYWIIIMIHFISGLVIVGTPIVIFILLYVVDFCNWIWKLFKYRKITPTVNYELVDIHV